MKNLTLTMLASAAAMSLAACDSGEVEDTAIDDVDAVVVTEEIGYPVGGELNPDQQAAYDAMDRQAVSDELDINYDAIRTERVANADLSASGNMSGSGSMESSDSMSGSDSMSSSGGDAMSGSGSMDSASSGSGMNMPPRSQMDFGWLDRNGDGQLSVAEYAIWSVPVDPTEPKPNDATKPYMTQDQINQAGQTFFYFDQDGTSYLSPEEFMMARNSAMTPS